MFPRTKLKVVMESARFNSEWKSIIIWEKEHKYISPISPLPGSGEGWKDEILARKKQNCFFSRNSKLSELNS